MVLSRNRVQGRRTAASPLASHLPPPLTAGAGDRRTCATPKAPLPAADQSARSKVTAHPHPPRQRPTALGGQGQVPGAGSGADSTREAPPRDRKMAAAAAAPGPGPSASPRPARAPRRERAREGADRARSRRAEGRSGAQPENGKCRAVGEGTLTRGQPPTFPRPPPPTLNLAVRPSHPGQLPSPCLPLNLRSVGGSRTRICSCFAMAPEADAIGETAQSGGAPAAAVC